jgi:sugar phosphate isomerase/epimerase
MRVAASSLIWNHPKGAAFRPWLAEVRALGYDGIAGFPETGWAEHMGKGAEFRRAADEQGLAVASLATGLHTNAERYREIAEFMREVGCEEIVLIGAPGDDYSDFGRIAEHLNRAAAGFAEFGIVPSYHNSSKPRPMLFSEVCMVLDRADPGLVGFMCDTGHATRDFADLPLAERPTRLLERYWERLRFVELKDYHPATDINTPVGEGLCPWDEVVGLLRRRRYGGWIVVEQNGNLGLSRGRSGGECARLSREFIRRRLGA